MIAEGRNAPAIHNTVAEIQRSDVACIRFTLEQDAGEGESEIGAAEGEGGAAGVVRWAVWSKLVPYGSLQLPGRSQLLRSATVT